MASENRAKPSLHCSWLKIGVVCAILIALFVVYYFIGCNDADSTYSTGFALTTKYSIDEMREFAYKNRETVKPSLYVRWNLSFNRMLEDPTNRYGQLVLRIGLSPIWTQVGPIIWNMCRKFKIFWKICITHLTHLHILLWLFNICVYRFNLSADDVLVFLHIQKTAGTSFEKFLVKHLNINEPCVCNMGKKKCVCRRPGSSREVWLFSRYSTGWACGLHADFTELYVSGCVEHVIDKKEGEHYSKK